MNRIVPVKFRPAGRHYQFAARDLELQPEDRVVVETDRGRALGTVVAEPREVPPGETPADLKNVLRLATEADLELADTNAAREAEAFRYCKSRIEARGMEMKLVRAEYLFDGSKIVFYFTADGRVDFRELVKDLAHYFHTRIEMRQIGVRDEAKLTGGLGICGRELCCCTWLTEFAPVSVKMAKEQGLALNPNKISGQCGRLLCCLNYEFETYCALRKGLPKCGHRVVVEGREGEVVDQDILRQKVKVRMADGQTLEADPDSLQRDSAHPDREKPSRSAPASGRGERRSRPSGREDRPQKEPSGGGGKPQGSEQPAKDGQDSAQPGKDQPRRRRRRRSRGRRDPAKK